MNITRLPFFAVMFLCAAAQAGQDEPDAGSMLHGDWTQGHVVLGHAPPGTHAWFNGRLVHDGSTPG